eukprot:TRINITY_DN8309_c1_g1_i1.p1 TRINITY_DN8309_c1_g1~~TRINITY_DN8309_c1_g1_i1.p1  ORF type:complete len:520 (+),score=235.63 TRINITY_DN8309_c1_g1_i1:113-1672(+)
MKSDRKSSVEPRPAPVLKGAGVDAAFLEKIAELDKKQEAASHDRCTVWREPGRVLVFSTYWILKQALGVGHYIATHPVFFLAALPLMAVYTYLLFVLEGPHVEYIHQFNLHLQDMIFWFVLGVASSIGFGSGMHSGVVFLFPHIYKVCMAADMCHTLQFGSNVFLRDGPAEGLNVLPIGDVLTLPGYCECDETEGGTMPVAFLPRVLGVMWACVVWGAGTALGEVPPYFLARKAARGGLKQEALEEEMHSSLATLEAMKKWMIGVVEHYGFIAVFLFASWPNAFFDLCGLCCGAINMPFFTFFSAVFLGKAVVKVGLQAMFFVLIFTESSFKRAIAILTSILELLPGDYGEQAALELNRFANAQIDRFKHGHKHKGEGGNAIVSMIVFLFVAHFLAKALEQLAVDRERELDAEHIEHLKDMKKRGDEVVLKARESSSRPYSLLIVIPAVSYAAAVYLGAEIGLTFLLPAATLACVSVLEPKKVTAPLNVLWDGSIVSCSLWGLAAVLLPLVLQKVQAVQ